MIRVLAIVALLAALLLVLGQSGHRHSLAAAVPDDMSFVSAPVDPPALGTTHHGKARCPPSHAFCYAGLTLSFIPAHCDTPLRNGDRNPIGLYPGARRLRAAFLKRDPPVPRSSV